MTNRLDRGYERYKEEFEEAALRVLRSGRYILGNEVESFEAAWAGYTGAAHCTGVASGLDALYLALRACDIKAGDEVIVQGNTFFATALAVHMTGARCVFTEPDKYHQLDPAGIEAKINDRTKAVMVVHLYGQTARMTEIKEICKKHGLRLIEDCAQSHGSMSDDGCMSGHSGDFGCFSFYPSKNLGAFGDAGAVVTDDAELDRRLKQLRNYGSSRRYHYAEAGVNSRLDELQAALLSVRLSHLDELTKERKEAAAFYDTHIENPLIEKPEVRPGADHVYHQYVIRCDRREELIKHLDERGIDTIIHYPVPPHLTEALAYLGYKKGDLPFTEKLADSVLSIPMYNGITREEQERVAEALNGFGD